MCAIWIMWCHVAHTHLSLDHVASSGPHAPNEPKHIHTSLGLDPLQLSEQRDEGAGPAYPSAAVHHHGPALGGVLNHHLVHKV